MKNICRFILLFSIFIVIFDNPCSGNEGKKKGRSIKEAKGLAIMRKENKKMAKKADRSIESIEPINRFRKKVKRKRSKTFGSNAEILGKEKKIRKTDLPLKDITSSSNKLKKKAGRKRLKKIIKKPKTRSLESNPAPTGDKNKFRRTKTKTETKSSRRYVQNDYPTHLLKGGSNTAKRIIRKTRKRRTKPNANLVATTKGPSKKRPLRKIEELPVTVAMPPMKLTPPLNPTPSLKPEPPMNPTPPRSVFPRNSFGFPLTSGSKVARSVVPPPEGQPKTNPVITLFVTNRNTGEIFAMPIEEAAKWLPECELIFLSHQPLPKHCQDPERTRNSAEKTNRKITSEEANFFHEVMPKPKYYDETEEEYKKRFREALERSEHFPG